MVTAKQKANRARFAAMARSKRGAVAFPTAGQRGFGGRFASGLRTKVRNLTDAFHNYRWGEAALAFLGGYYLPQTLDQLGVGNMLYARSPQYAALNDAWWGAAGGGNNPNNPWGNGGMVGYGKLAGVGGMTKIGYDYEKTGRISRARANFAIPAMLGLILDGPELSPQGGAASPGDGSWQTTASPSGFGW